MIASVQKYAEGPNDSIVKPMVRGAAIAPQLDASTSVEAVATRFPGGTQSLARATNWPYSGNTKAPNTRLTPIRAILDEGVSAPITAKPQEMLLTPKITARRG